MASEVFNADVASRIEGTLWELGLGHADFGDPGGIVWAGVIGQTGDGDLTILDGAGHNAWIDRPQDFQRALQRYLEEIGGD